MDNLVSGMCGVGGGYDRVPFKVVGDGRADAELIMEEGAWRGQLQSEDRILRGL